MSEELDNEAIEQFDLQLRDYLEHGVVAEGDVDALIESTLEAVGAEAEAFEPEPARTHKAWWVGVTTAALAAAAAWMLLPSNTAVPSQVPSLPGMELVYAAGDVQVDGGEAQLGALARGAELSTRSGQACMALRGWGDFCASEDSRVSLGEDGRPLVSSGGLLVALAAERELELMVGGDRVRGTGSQFSLYRKGQSERVEVALASLTIESAGQSWTLEAGQWMEWQDGKLLARGESDRNESSATFAMLGLGELWTAPLVAAGRVGTEGGVVAALRVDGRDLGPTPVRAFLPVGAHALHIEAAGYADFESDLDIVAGREFAVVAAMQSETLVQADPPVVEAVEPVEDSVEQVEAERPQREQATPSAEDLLAQARSAMKQKRWSDAARIYRRLRRVHPKGDLAHAALVSLGNLELEHLGSQSRARRAYEGYLRRPGALAQEARWGLVRASKGTRGERKVIEDYMRRYANSLEIGHLEKRLGELDAAAQ